MMSPVVLKMLTDLCRVDKQRQIEHRRAVEKADEEGPRLLARASLRVTAILGSCWTA